MEAAVKRGIVTAAARRAAVQRAIAVHVPAVRITEGQRRAIMGSAEFRDGRAAGTEA